MQVTRLQKTTSVVKKAVFRASETEFWVKLKSFPTYLPNPRNADSFTAHLTVLFERTRVVKIVEVNGMLCLTCSCKAHERNGYSCPCVFAVVDEAPKACDVAIHWHSSYYVLYLNGDTEIDKCFDKLVENEIPGLILPAGSALRSDQIFRSALA